jgi:hypothetical protein
MNIIANIRRRTLAALTPPPRLHLSDWIEQNIRLPEGVSALPGPVRLWPTAGTAEPATTARGGFCNGPPLTLSRHPRSEDDAASPPGNGARTCRA